MFQDAGLQRCAAQPKEQHRAGFGSTGDNEK